MKNKEIVELMLKHKASFSYINLIEKEAPKKEAPKSTLSARERERERERKRETEKRRDREREREKDRESERVKERKSEKAKERARARCACGCGCACVWVCEKSACVGVRGGLQTCSCQ